MDRRRKIDLLQQQIEAAQGGTPEDFQLWRQTTEVVLRNVVGDASPLYASFTSIRYSPTIWTDRTTQSQVNGVRAGGVRKAIAILEAAKTEVELSGGTPEAPDIPSATGRTIFVVHGHDNGAKHEVARFLSKLTGTEPVILHEQANQGRTLIEKFEDHAADAAYAIVIATPDDVGRGALEKDERPRPRQNVVFELGFFFGALGRSRVGLLYDETVERPSDIEGIVRIPLDAAGAWKMLVAREISAAGVGVEWSALGS